jgi:hypothetical protein
MTTIDPSNTTLLVEAEKWHAAALKEILSTVFEADPNLANEYFEALAKSSPEERLLALHDDPIDVATMLTGFSVDQDQLSAYSEMLKASEVISLEGLPKTLHPVRASTLDRTLRELGYERIQSGLGRPYHLWEQRGDLRSQLPQVLTLSTPQFRAEDISELVYDRGEVLDFLVNIATDTSKDDSGTDSRKLLDIFREMARG